MAEEKVEGNMDYTSVPVADVAALRASFEAHVLREDDWQSSMIGEFRELKADSQARQEKMAADLTEIKDILLKSIAPEVQEHRQTLYGPSPDKNNGMRSQVKELVEFKATQEKEQAAAKAAHAASQKRDKKWITLLVGIATLLSSSLGVAIAKAFGWIH